MEIPVPPEVLYEYKASAPRTTDVIHTSLDLHFDWEKESVKGIATIIASPYFYDLDTAVLDAKGFEIHSITLKSETDHPLEYTYDRRKLRIALGKTYTRKDTFTIAIDYTAFPSQLPKGGSAAITADQGMYFINAQGQNPNETRQIWTQGETEANSGWFPTVDKPNEKMTQEIFLTVENTFKTLSNGRLIYSVLHADGTRTDYWKQDKPHAPYLAMVAIGEFSEVQDTWRDLQVNYYVDSAYEDDAMAIFGNTPEMLTFYSTILGYDYPWEKYHQVVVHDFVSGAMENTTAVIHGEFVQRSKRQLIDADFEEVIAHELFHHWFGDLVTTESWSNLPLNEAFATYGEYLWIDHKYGSDEAGFHLMQDLQAYLRESETKNVDLIRFHYAHRDDMFDSHSYAKGGRVLHMLRQILGDEAFFASLRHYLEKHEYQTAEVHDLRLAFEETTGLDLNWFFDQWFLDNGHPKVDIRYRLEGDSLVVEISQLQDMERFPMYRLPLEIAIYENGKAAPGIEKVTVSGPESRFVFPVSNVDLVVTDAQQMMLWEKSEEKPDSWWAYQYRNGKKFLARYEALQNLHLRGKDSIATAVVREALDDPFWFIRQQALQYIDPSMFSARPDIPGKIRKMAQSDPKSQVRQTALSMLASLFPEDSSTLSIHVAALRDSSYLVLGTALAHFAETNPEKAISEAEKLEGTGEGSLIVPIAAIYASAAGPEKTAFFEKAAQEVHGPSVLNFSASYYAYATRTESQAALNNLQDFLVKITTSGKGWWIKYTGMTGLKELQQWHASKAAALAQDGETTSGLQEKAQAYTRQAEEIRKIMDRIIANEQDGKMKQMFEGL